MPGKHQREVAVGFCGALLRSVGPTAEELVARHRLAVFALPRGPTTTRGEQALAVGISIPRQPDEQIRQVLRRAIDSARKEGFQAAGRVLRLKPPRAASLDTRRWVGPSRFWTTVTPAVLGYGLGARSYRKRLLLGSLASVLLPGEADPTRRAATMERFVGKIQAHEEPWLPGAPPSTAFIDGRRAEVPMHYKITFRAPVEGPIVIGRDRLIGMGLLAPLGEVPT